MISELPKITMLLGNKCHDQRVTTEEIGKHRSETETEAPINELPGVSTATASDDEQEEPDISISMASDDEQHDHEVDEPDISTATASDERIIDIYPNDVGLWPCHIRDTFRDYWLEQGSKNCRNIHSDFKNSGVKEKNRIRHCTASLFTWKHSQQVKFMISPGSVIPKLRGSFIVSPANSYPIKQVHSPQDLTTGSTPVKVWKVMANHLSIEIRWLMRLYGVRQMPGWTKIFWRQCKLKPNTGAQYLLAWLM